MAARTSFRPIPLEQWSPGAPGLDRLTIPAALRSFKSDGNYGSAKLPGGEWLVWAEPVGAVTVAVYKTVRPTWTNVVIVDTKGRIERMTGVAIAAAPRSTRECYVWANRRAIETAQLAVLTLREQQAPAAPAKGEAWLRRQLKGLGNE